MPTELTNLLAKKFISRPDAKAIQHPEGHYTLHAKYDRQGVEIERYPWDRPSLEAHINGTRTFGHYLLSREDTVKLFAFDIDLMKPDPIKKLRYFYPEERDGAWGGEKIEFNPREAWLDRRHPARNWMKYQFKMTAAKLIKVIHEDLELPCAVAYSGGKGIHVYAFTGPIPASEARDGAQIVLDTLDEWVPLRGENFYKHKDQDHLTGYPNLSIEVFPKQDSLNGKDLGNLMRLPLGRNLKSKDPTFFIDMSGAMADMKPVDPIWALSQGALNPWAVQCG